MPVHKLRFVLGDQLDRNLSSLQDIDPKNDFVLMSEVQGECSYVRHHKQKIVLILSAMRHFATMLVRSGIRVDYIKLNDPENTGSLEGELKRALVRHQVDRIVVTEPGEWRLWEMMQSWEQTLGTQVEIREDDR